MATQPLWRGRVESYYRRYLESPPTYLAKILQESCRGACFIRSAGKQGGFCLRERSDKINLMQIATLAEGPGFTDNCVLGARGFLTAHFQPLQGQTLDMLPRPSSAANTS